MSQMDAACTGETASVPATKWRVAVHVWPWIPWRRVRVSGGRLACRGDRVMRRCGLPRQHCYVTMAMLNRLKYAHADRFSDIRLRTFLRRVSNGTASWRKSWFVPGLVTPWQNSSQCRK